MGYTWRVRCTNTRMTHATRLTQSTYAVSCAQTAYGTVTLRCFPRIAAARACRGPLGSGLACAARVAAQWAITVDRSPNESHRQCVKPAVPAEVARCERICRGSAWACMDGPRPSVRSSQSDVCDSCKLATAAWLQHTRQTAVAAAECSACDSLHTHALWILWASLDATTFAPVQRRCDLHAFSTRRRHSPGEQRSAS